MRIFIEQLKMPFGFLMKEVKETQECEAKPDEERIEEETKETLP